MKESYETPKMELIELNVEGVILATSGGEQGKTNSHDAFEEGGSIIFQ